MARFSRVFVIGHSHCGSTLLGRMLDMHPAIICCGELLWLDDAISSRLPCLCGRSLEECGFWRLLLNAWPAAARADYRRTGLAELEGLRRGAGRELLLDLSKSRVWRHPIFRRDPAAGYVFVLRDPRALIASRLREGGRLRHELVRHAKWQERFAKMIERAGARGLAIRYEELADNPEKEIRRVCGFLGLDYDPALLKPAQREHHFVHSSSSPYLRGSGEIRRDERWRSELSAGELALIRRRLWNLPGYRGSYDLSS